MQTNQTSSAKQDDRRASRRAKIMQWVRVRPSDPKDEHFEEVRSTMSVSRNGVYFTSWSPTYYEGQRLFVTYPYENSPTAMNREYLAEVVRLDAIGEGLLGVGVRLEMELTVRPGPVPPRIPRG